MAETTTGQMKPTLGLTGLTSNAMALIAPGAFLWLTFQAQASYGVTGPAMWMGIVAAIVLCLLTAVCYAELAKLYPGTGSSYYFAEQAFLSREGAFRYARISKFVVGWGSHLYYWIYPGVMVGVTGIVVGYVTGTIWPNFMSASNPGPLFMMIVAVLFSFAIAYIAYRGISSSTNINLAINIIQITALLIFSIVAIGYRVNHPEGSKAFQFDANSGATYDYEFSTHKEAGADVIDRDQNGIPLPAIDPATGKPKPFQVSYLSPNAGGSILVHENALSVVRPHNLSWVFLQATVAILILVGFESVTTMGAEAKKASHIPIAVILSLLIQGLVFYIFEYFAANYFLNSGYTLTNAQGSAAPIGDMMIIAGDWLFGPGNGKTFMLVEAFTVFLALIGTTLSCMNTAARVTYTMGKDAEAPEHFGMLHSKTLTPHRAIWTLAVISAVIGCIVCLMPFGDASAPADAAIQALPHGIFSSLGYSTHDKMAAWPNTFITLSLASNFGTFLLYALSCLLCLVAYWKHPKFNFLLHLIIPVLGLVANLACMIAYLVLPVPFFGFNVGTWKEPYAAVAIAAIWGIYGGIYFLTNSKKAGKPALLKEKTAL